MVRRTRLTSSNRSTSGGRPHKFVVPFTTQSDIAANRVPDTVTGPIRGRKRENTHRNQKRKREGRTKQDKIHAEAAAIRRRKCISLSSPKSTTETRGHRRRWGAQIRAVQPPEPVANVFPAGLRSTESSEAGELSRGAKGSDRPEDNRPEFLTSRHQLNDPSHRVPESNFAVSGSAHEPLAVV